VCTAFPGSAFAQLPNNKTTVNLDVPTEIPGPGAQVLPPGAYVFKLLDSRTDRYVVQILSSDESHVYATILAVPNSRMTATDQTVVTFTERPAGSPRALKAWFYPGDKTGEEFVYPKSRAVELAAVAKEPIPYVPDAMASNMAAPVRAATEAPVAALVAVPVRAVTPSGDDVALAELVQPRPTQMAAATLPKTASTTPVVVVVGLLCLVFGLSLARRPKGARPQTVSRD
jgi:hypothetical protein